MKTRIRLPLCFLLLVANVGTAHAAPSDAIDDALARNGFDETWIRSFAESWDELEARTALPAETAAAIAGLLRPEWMPSDPAEAAGVLHETVREAEVQRRRGEPLWRITKRLAHTLSQQGQAGAALARKLRRDAAKADARLAKWRAKKAADGRSGASEEHGHNQNDEAGDGSSQGGGGRSYGAAGSGSAPGGVDGL